MWAAKQGLAALQIDWDEGPNAELSSAQLWQALREASRQDGAVAKVEGDAAAALKDGELIEAAYEMPFLAHATMEPMNCTVHLTPGACEIWVGSQVLSRAQAIAMKLDRPAAERSDGAQPPLGGGFGRRLEADMADKAARIAQHVDGPVKVVWLREEDVRHDIYRPLPRPAQRQLQQGRIARWKHRITGSSVIARWLPPAFQKGIDIDASIAPATSPTTFPNLRVEFMRAEPQGVPTGFWRGVGPNNNVFAIESFMDELAQRPGRSGRVPPPHAGQATAPESCARAGRR